MKSSKWLLMILLTSFLTACGGDGGSDDVAGSSSNDTLVTTSIKSGIAVDPYITGAQFEELSADEQTLIQGSAGTSSATGQFAFNEPIKVGSIIRINLNSKGQHANEPYTGVIKRQVFADDKEPVVVSPLTTLLANGMTPAAVIQMMNSAGLSGLTASRLYADPMATVSASDLVLLQANMSVNAFMEATNNFNYGGGSPAADSPVHFNDIAAMVRESLNPVLYQQMSSAIGADFTVGDMANMAAVIMKDAVRQAKSGIPMDSVTTVDNDLANAINIADGFYQARMGMGGGTADPGTGGGTPDPGTGGGTTDPGTGGGTLDPGTGGGTTPSTPDGQAIFTGATGANCSLCHTVGTSDTSYRELAGDGAKVTTRFGGGTAHNGLALTADEMTAIATYFDSQGGTTTPGTGGGTTDPGTGGGTTDPGTGGGTTDPGTGGGTTDPGTGGGTTPSTPDGQAIFTGATGANCSLCHTVGTSDTSYRELAGDGAKVTTRFGGGTAHNGLALTADEMTAIATYFDSQGGTTTPGTGGGTPDPGTGGGTPDPGTDGGTTPSTPDGQALVSSNCIGCHNIGQGGTMDLSGKGDAAYGNITSGHKGISMTDPNANAVADYLDTLTPPTDPTAPFVHAYFSDAGKDHRNYVDKNGTSNCVTCHGADLRGSGSAPSCYSCHGQKW